MHVYRIAAFTEAGAGGNPAGVVLSERLPHPDIMQRMAAEIGYSETVFAALAGDHWQTRYFSPENEVPFCGHATIALGAVLAEHHGSGQYRLSLSQGEVEVQAEIENGTAFATLRSLPTRNSLPPDEVVAGALALFGYVSGDLDEILPPRLIHAGAQHLLLALKSRERLAAMHYSLDQGRAFMLRHGIVTIMLVWRESERLFHARNAFAFGGVIEDPATGAAAAALAGMLRDRELLPEGALTILQGADMGRPSRIEVDFGPETGSPVNVSGAASKIG